jgi:hypothetical protein
MLTLFLFMWYCRPEIVTVKLFTIYSNDNKDSNTHFSQRLQVLKHTSQTSCVGHMVLMSALINSLVFWDLAPCRLVCNYQPSGVFCLCLGILWLWRKEAASSPLSVVIYQSVWSNIPRVLNFKRHPCEDEVVLDQIFVTENSKCLVWVLCSEQDC